MTVETQARDIEPGAHLVHFYDHDAELAVAVAGHLAGALHSGGVAIVIATEVHRRAISRELASAGVDVAGAMSDGKLVDLDAAGALSEFSTGGSLDSDAFDRVIGGVVRRAARAETPIHAYGEMVALLWDEGQVLAAIELEKLWNDLADELSFHLLCGYRSEAVAGEEHAQTRRHICELHTGVLTGRQQLEREFAPDSVAPRSARRFVAEALRQWGHGDAIVQDAKLVVSELATNAVTHAGSAFSVIVRGDDAGVRISVADRSPAQPRVMHASPEAPSGRGLDMVSALSDRWGVDANKDGKAVWAQLRP